MCAHGGVQAHTGMALPRATSECTCVHTYMGCTHRCSERGVSHAGVRARGHIQAWLRLGVCIRLYVCTCVLRGARVQKGVHAGWASGLGAPSLPLRQEVGPLQGGGYLPAGGGASGRGRGRVRRVVWRAAHAHGQVGAGARRSWRRGRAGRRRRPRGRGWWARGSL